MLERVDPHKNGDTMMVRGASRLVFRWLAVVLVSVLVFSSLYAFVRTLDFEQSARYGYRSPQYQAR